MRDRINHSVNSGLALPVEIADDFYGVRTDYAGGVLLASPISSGTLADGLPLAGEFGVVLFKTSAAANSGYSITTLAALNLGLTLNQKVPCEMFARVLWLAVQLDSRGYIGFFDNRVTATEPINGIYFRIQPMGGHPEYEIEYANITYVIRNNNVESISPPVEYFPQDGPDKLLFEIIIEANAGTITFSLKYSNNNPYNTFSFVGAAQNNFPANKILSFGIKSYRTAAAGGALDLLKEDSIRFRGRPI
jgi:hypothetical protein